MKIKLMVILCASVALTACGGGGSNNNTQPASTLEELSTIPTPSPIPTGYPTLAPYPVPSPDINTSPQLPLRAEKIMYLALDGGKGYPADFGLTDTAKDDGAIIAADRICNSDIAKPKHDPNIIYKAVYADGKKRVLCNNSQCATPEENIDWPLQANTTYYTQNYESYLVTDSAGNPINYHDKTLRKDYLATKEQVAHWSNNDNKKLLPIIMTNLRMDGRLIGSEASGHLTPYNRGWQDAGNLIGGYPLWNKEQDQTMEEFFINSNLIFEQQNTDLQSHTSNADPLFEYAGYLSVSIGDNMDNLASILIYTICHQAGDPNDALQCALKQKHTNKISFNWLNEIHTYNLDLSSPNLISQLIIKAEADSLPTIGLEELFSNLGYHGLNASPLYENFKAQIDYSYSYLIEENNVMLQSYFEEFKKETMVNMNHNGSNELVPNGRYGFLCAQVN